MYFIILTSNLSQKFIYFFTSIYCFNLQLWYIIIPKKKRTLKNISMTEKNGGLNMPMHIIKRAEINIHCDLYV